MLIDSCRYSISSCLLAGLFLCGCGSIEERFQGSGLAQEPGGEISPVQAPVGLSRKDLEAKERERLENGNYAIRIDRTLIYPCRWLKADDLAVTLQPLLESRYGNGVRVVPHAATNHLLIYIPPFHEREHTTRRAVSTASTGRSRTVRSPSTTTSRRSGS